jgi:hypothetical protein
MAGVDGQRASRRPIRRNRREEREKKKGEKKANRNKPWSTSKIGEDARIEKPMPFIRNGTGGRSSKRTGNGEERGGFMRMESWGE